MPFLSLLAVTMGLERMAGAVMLLTTATCLIYAMRGKLNGWVAGGGAVLALYAMRIAFGDQDFTAGSAVAAVVSVLVPLGALAWKRREGRLLALCLLLMAAGYSTHVYLPIRAAQKPAINEGAPATWDKLRDLLERKQYGEMNMFKRRGTLQSQLDKEFWRYFSRQWPLYNVDKGPGDVLPRVWIGSTWDRPLAGMPLGSTIPLLLGVAGGIWLAMREKKSFLYSFVFLGLSTAGMILFLNFSDNEVRERDYFFQSGYHAYAMWIGLGVAWAVAFVRGSFAGDGARRMATAGSAALFGLMPAALCANFWYTHDRSGHWVARDYAYNMLAPLAPNSYMFTNGDNDTFPLWYIQEVEGFRRDVRVVNLSLLNTDWYIRQLRDEQPRVPITFDDGIVDQLGMGAVLDSAGRIVYTNEIMVHHILDQSRQGGAWVKQPYFAVTVPEDFGYRRNFSHQGLVYEVKADTAQAGFDEAATRKALYETFQYRGLFEKDGSWDKKVFKDENASTLTRNYAAAHLQLAYHYRNTGRLPAAIQEFERIARMFPDMSDVLLPLGNLYMEAGDTTRALDLFGQIARRDPGNPEARYYHAAALAYRGQVEDAVREFDASIQLDPNYMQGYFGAYTALWQSGAKERAMGYLQRWVEGHPNDAQAMALLQQSRMELGLPPLPGRTGALPPPPTPERYP
jgi:tetratricopeptide (TPR) repeat protein